eukprot:8223480-Heterocapsa_arctica.AAC.1
MQHEAYREWSRRRRIRITPRPTIHLPRHHPGLDLLASIRQDPSSDDWCSATTCWFSSICALQHPE